MLNIKLVSWALGLWGTRCLIRLSKQHRGFLRHPWFRGHALHDIGASKRSWPTRALRSCYNKIGATSTTNTLGT